MYIYLYIYLCVCIYIYIGIHVFICALWGNVYFVYLYTLSMILFNSTEILIRSELACRRLRASLCSQCGADGRVWVVLHFWVKSVSDAAWAVLRVLVLSESRQKRVYGHACVCASARILIHTHAHRLEWASDLQLLSPGIGTWFSVCVCVCVLCCRQNWWLFMCLSTYESSSVA